MRHNGERETVTVLLDYRGPERGLRPFHCVRCGKLVCEVTGQATTVVPGEPEGGFVSDIGTSVAVLCGGTVWIGRGRGMRCGAKYLFT